VDYVQSQKLASRGATFVGKCHSPKALCDLYLFTEWKSDTHSENSERTLELALVYRMQIAPECQLQNRLV
jgi:hypothetical protein